MSTSSPRPAPIQNPQVPREEIEFSHPSEEELARILDFYGIEWRYEPTTFPLEWDEQGSILEGFSPDFLLVEVGLYIELTTLRSRLMRLKHRKVRRLRELYPEIKIRLWDRKDFQRFLEHLGLEDQSSLLIGKEAVEKQNGGT